MGERGRRLRAGLDRRGGARRRGADRVDVAADGAVVSVDAAAWYADADGDGYTDPATGTLACDAPDGYVEPSDADDCDDADPSAYPDADEVPGDGIDQDCDGADLPAPGDTGAVPTQPKPDASGCGCEAGDRPDAGGILGLVGALAVLRRRR